MNEEYLTETGVELRTGRIPRQRIDRFIADNPPPEPPTRELETWVGDTEPVADYEAPEYLAAMAMYYAQLGYEQIELIAEAIEVVELPEQTALELADMRALGIVRNEADALCNLVLRDSRDMSAVVERVMYLSTVTARGIAEAAEQFGVTWNGRRVAPAVPPGKGGGHALGAFTDRQVARWSRYKWVEFCELSGPEQSAEVAFYRLSMQLERRVSRKGGRK